MLLYNCALWSSTTIHFAYNSVLGVFRNDSYLLIIYSLGLWKNCDSSTYLITFSFVQCTFTGNKGSHSSDNSQTISAAQTNCVASFRFTNETVNC